MKRMDVKIPSFLFVILIGFLSSCRPEIPENHQPTVEVRYENGRAVLYRHGSPYYIKGAAGTEYMDKVAAFGGNSIRTWNLQDSDSILDKAHELGLTVTLGLEIGRPHWGNDFNYWNIREVDRKIEELRPFIVKYKNHPALLMWGVGNEVKEYGGSKRWEVYLLLNRIAKMIKEVDPDHPTVTAIDTPSQNARLGIYRFLMPSLDVIGFNTFKNPQADFKNIYGRLGWGKPYIFSEWGTYGHWEISETEWGAPYEPKDPEKVSIMESSWNTIQSDTVMLLGSYIFYWGSKHEATHTWFSMFSKEGHESPSVQFLKKAWSGKPVENEAPRITEAYIENKFGILRDNLYLDNNQVYKSIVKAEDPEGDSLTFVWEIRPEENYALGKNYSHPIDSLIVNTSGPTVEFRTPIDEGPFRIFVYALDGKGNFSSYNIPFYVLKR